MTLLKCIKPLRFFRRDFALGDVVDVAEFAGQIRRHSIDADHLLDKMLRPMMQVGSEMVPCFDVADGGGAEDDELRSESAGPYPANDEEEAEPEVDEGEAEDGGEDEVERPVDADDDEWPKKSKGFGWYLLSNGEKVQGQDKARAAQEALNSDPQ